MKIILVGGGLSGGLLAVFLAKRGHKVEILESRPDMRKTQISAGRSINLALSNRGIRALRRAGLAEQVLAEAVPMYGRMTHSVAGDLKLLPYGKNNSEYINAISRGELNKIVLNAAEAYPNVSVRFLREATKVDFDTKTVHCINKKTNELELYSTDLIIGTDGANSAVREAIRLADSSFKSSIDWLEHGYKELVIPATADGGYQIEKNVLHIWGRSSYMLIALPNFDGSFTCTLFLAMQGAVSFEQLQTREAVRSFFEAQFPDFVRLVPDYVEQFLNNPLGKLGTLRCAPWSWGGCGLILGDAAHAIVPFYGQGMNASFEDCAELDALMEEYPNDWATIFSLFQQRRKPNADAIASLAVENFYEMRDAVNDPVFLRKRLLEHDLENAYPEYRSKYALVTFCDHVPYSYAHQQGNKQDAYLMKLCANAAAVENPNLEAIYAAIRKL